MSYDAGHRAIGDRITDSANANQNIPLDYNSAGSTYNWVGSGTGVSSIVSEDSDAIIPLEDGFPSFVLLNSTRERVRVIKVLFGAGYCDLVVLRRSGDMIQISISECTAPEDYVEYMFDQRDAIIL